MDINSTEGRRISAPKDRDPGGLPEETSPGAMGTVWWKKMREHCPHPQRLSSLSPGSPLLSSGLHFCLCIAQLGL